MAFAFVFAGATSQAISLPSIPPASHSHNHPHLLGDGLTTYRYDSEGRLESASTGEGEDAPTTKYANNALGQRVFKTEPLYSSGTQSSGSTSSKTGKNLNNLLADDDEAETTAKAEQPGLVQWFLSFWSRLWSPSTSDAEKLGFSYVYAEDGSLLGEYGSGGSNSSGTAQYIYLPTASGPMPIAAVIKGTAYAVHSDHLNTPRKLTQADGQTAWQWAYSAFGDEQPTIGAKRFTNETTTPTTGATSIPEVTFNLRYPGQYFDKETKLHYNYHRSYAPGTGRYTQGDPIGLDGGWNGYLYASANPLSFVDPDGLLFLDLTTFEGAKNGVTLDEAIQRGEGFRGVGGPVIAGAIAAPIVGAVGIEAAVGIAACYRVPQTLYHFTTREAAQKITQDGLIRVGQNNLYGRGVYATRFDNGLMARIQGANSVEAKIIINNTAPFRPTPFPGTFRTPGTPVPLR
ncbi:hypothetical protein ASE39_19100 [Acidovorax sp. Root267]|nr:hypothetical protein ASE39_19100 [Acidovorax sp. Root267]